MEVCDFAAAEKDLPSEIERLVGTGKLSREQADAIEKESVKAFFTSSLYRRIKASDTVLREYRFTVAKSVRDLHPDLPEAFRDEKTVVDGKTDLIFMEDGAAVIVDYKTDRVQDPADLLARYTPQMRLYAEAVAQVLGVPVKECLLYSLALNTTVSV